MRRAALLGLLIFGPAAAQDAGPPPPSPSRYEIVRAQVSASAGTRPEAVLDQDTMTGWCTEGGGLLTIELARPVTMDRVVVTPGIVDKVEDTLDRPPVIEVALDGAELDPVRGEHPESETIVVEAGGAQVRKVTLRVPPGGARACISGIALERGRYAHSLVRTIDDVRLVELRATIERLREAASSCDARVLGELSIFPLTYAIVEREGVTRSTRGQKGSIRHLGELVNACRQRPFEDTGVRELDGDTVSVWARGDWVLRWKRPDGGGGGGGGWRLVELPDDFPRR